MYRPGVVALIVLTAACSTSANRPGASSPPSAEPSISASLAPSVVPSVRIPSAAVASTQSARPLALPRTTAGDTGVCGEVFAALQIVVNDGAESASAIQADSDVFAATQEYGLFGVNRQLRADLPSPVLTQPELQIAAAYCRSIGLPNLNAG